MILKNCSQSIVGSEFLFQPQQCKDDELKGWAVLAVIIIIIIIVMEQKHRQSPFLRK